MSRQFVAQIEVRPRSLNLAHVALESPERARRLAIIHRVSRSLVPAMRAEHIFVNGTYQGSATEEDEVEREVTRMLRHVISPDPDFQANVWVTLRSF